jgi:hypothetical protein
MKVSLLPGKVIIITRKYLSNFSWVLVAHACNPSYSGGRDQKDCSSKPAQANSFQDPISKKPITKIGLVE